MSDVTQILNQIRAGDPDALRDLMPLVYDEVRQLAAKQLAQEGPGQTLQATALVHEAYLRLVGATKAGDFKCRRHFFGAAAEAIRRILIDRARRRGRDKHGGQLRRVDLADPAAKETDDEILALDAALPRLKAEDPIAAEIVTLKYFAGLGREEIAATVGCTVHEVRRKLEYARAWLRLALED